MRTNSLMLREIREQPQALARTLTSAQSVVQELKKRFATRRPRLIILVARGTSDNAALFGRYLLEVSTGIPVSLAAPSILTVYRSRLDLKDTLVVGISQSGESTDTNYVLEWAAKAGAATLGITNRARSSLAKIPDHLLLVKAGPERSVAATKTYTGQMLALYLLAHALGARIRMRDLERLPELAAKALKTEPEVAERAERYRFMRYGVVVGRGLNYANAFELALKLMETCYVVAERFSSADFLHGPIALVEPSFPVFLYASPGPVWRSLKEILDRLEALQAELLVFTDRGHREAYAARRRAIVVPEAVPVCPGMPEDLLTPIPYIIPGQLLAAYLAREKGLNPDRPRSLQKVTLTL